MPSPIDPPFIERPAGRPRMRELPPGSGFVIATLAMVPLYLGVAAAVGML